MRGFARWTAAALTAVALSCTGVLASEAGPARASLPHIATYVSLGDSLAYGYQPNLIQAGDSNPADYVSYAEIYAGSRLSVANFGCPGETTVTMINGDCAGLGSNALFPNGIPLHMSYHGDPQLQAALNYLRGHRATTTLISVDIGSNDLIAILKACGGSDLTCIAGKLPAVFHNYASIVSQLRAAAPQARMVLFNIYNPYALTIPGSDALLTTFVNPAIARLAASSGASVADAFAAINDTAGSRAEATNVCSLTWMCAFAPPNIHPTDSGYEKLAVALKAAAR